MIGKLFAGGGKNGQESRLLLLGKMKHLPESERVSFGKKNRI
jgi:hypothetical protein